MHIINYMIHYMFISSFVLKNIWILFDLNYFMMICNTIIQLIHLFKVDNY